MREYWQDIGKGRKRERSRRKRGQGEGLRGGRRNLPRGKGYPNPTVFINEKQLRVKKMG